MTRSLLTLTLALLLVLPGCITFYGDDTVQARILITENMGTQTLHEANVTAPENATVLDALRKVATVETEYGGFITAINDKQSRYPDTKTDWFYHVNTQLATTGAASNTIHNGDLILWDYRPWNHTLTLPHILTGLDTWPNHLTTNPTPTPHAWNQTTNHPTQHEHLFARIHNNTLTLLDPHREPTTTIQPPWLLIHAAQNTTDQPRYLVQASSPQALPLTHHLDTNPPTGLGIAITPNTTHQVPAS